MVNSTYRPAWLVAATLVPGSLDLGLGAVLAMQRGKPAGRMLQSIASGVLGPDSYALGAKSMWLGAVLHYSLIFAMAVGGFFLTHRLAFVRRHPVIAAVAYGVILCFAMERVVVPLSAAPFHMPWSVEGLASSLLSHVLFVAAPIMAMARRAQGVGRR